MIDDAARATRRYAVGDALPRFVIDNEGPWINRYATAEEAQAACDRLNLAAVLRAIREPTQECAMPRRGQT